MDRIHLIMPMAGGGTRFSEHGFNVPKPLIDLHGRPFFYWATESILRFVEVQDVIFVVLRDHIRDFEIDKEIHKFYPTAKIKILDEVLNGAVLTCMEAVKEIQDNLPVLFNDCDHAFVANSFYRYAQNVSKRSIDGGLLTFKSTNPNYSYVVFDRNGKVSGTVEKSVASSEAICGAYYFRNKDVFQQAARLYIDHCSYQEYYLSGLYNEMVSIGNTVEIFPLDKHISFGTPEEYEEINNCLIFDI